MAEEEEEFEVGDDELGAELDETEQDANQIASAQAVRLCMCTHSIHTLHTQPHRSWRP